MCKCTADFVQFLLFCPACAGHLYCMNGENIDDMEIQTEDAQGRQLTWEDLAEQDPRIMRQYGHCKQTDIRPDTVR